MRRLTYPVGFSLICLLGSSALTFAQYSPRPTVEQVDMGKVPTPEVQRSNVEVVNQLFEALKHKDFAKAESLLATNAEWRINQDRPTPNQLIGALGKASVMTQLKELLGGGDFDTEIRRSVTMGPIVINERSDRLPALPATQGRAASSARTVHVNAGVFFVDNGTIREWTDYTGMPVSPDEQKSNLEVVAAFCSTYEARDLTKAVSLLAENIAKKNPNQTWGQALLGREAVSDYIKRQVTRGDMVFRLFKEPEHNIAIGPIVLNDREDLVPGPDSQPGRWFLVHAGVWYVQSGKIVDWSDYRQ
jgi:limonene-1,2-epoxide hydrolase